MVRYIYRIDDITDDMNWDNFNKCMNLFNRYSVRPLLGVVPDNKDKILKVSGVNKEFWVKMKEIQDNNKAEFAMHGYQHLYESSGESILSCKYGYKKESEFSGLPYEEQFIKLKKGKEVLDKNGIKSEVFMAPGHTFDRNTINALENLNFKYITDGVGLTPYNIGKMKLIPQQYGKPRSFPFGTITICLHINNFSNNDFNALENHIKKNKKNIISFSEASNIKENKFLNKIFEIFYLSIKLLKAKLIYKKV